MTVERWEASAVVAEWSALDTPDGDVVASVDLDHGTASISGRLVAVVGAPDRDIDREVLMTVADLRDFARAIFAATARDVSIADRKAAGSVAYAHTLAAVIALLTPVVGADQARSAAGEVATAVRAGVTL